MTALHVQRSSFGSPTVDQVARPVLILRIFFDYFTVGNGLPHFLHVDATENALVDSVLGELELVSLELLAEIIYERHMGSQQLLTFGAFGKRYCRVWQEP